MIIARVVKSFRIGRVFVVVIIGKHHVQVFAVFTRDLGLIGGPIQFSLAIQIGDILLGPRPGPAIIPSDKVGPGAGMTIGAVIDHLLVAMDSVHRRIG